MKVLKFILVLIIIIVAIVLIVPLFVAKDYSIQRNIVINQPKQKVFEYIKLARNQEHYNKWWMMDPDSKKDFRGTDGTVGFVASWDSKKEKSRGEQETMKIVDGQQIDFELRFKLPFEGTSYSGMTTDAAGDNQTKVTWIFSGKNKYPMNGMNLFMDKMMGKDLDTSLVNLKAELEK